MFDKLVANVQRLSPGARKILGNVGWLFIERILTIIVNFWIGIYVIRYLGAENFGNLSYSISFVALFSPIANLGFNEIVVRDIVRREKKEKEVPEILGTAFVFKLIACTLTIALVGLATGMFIDRADTRSMTLLLASGLVFTAFDTIEFWFQSQVLSGVMALLRTIQVIFSSLVKLFFITFHLPLIAFVWLLLAEQMFKAVGMVWIYLQHRQSLADWKVNWSIGLDMLRDSWPLILSGVMVTIYMKIDQVMLGNMSNTEEVGNYAAAARLSEIWYFIPVVICSSVFPAILRARQRSAGEYYARLQQLYDIMAWIALVITVPMTFLSVPLMVTLLGTEYASAGTILAWHIWSGPFVFLGVASGKWLTAENLTRFSFFMTSLGAIANIGLNMWLIPPYGGVGAAIATAVSQALAAYLAKLFYPRTFPTGLMLTKALLIPFRFQQNLTYLNQIKKILS